MNTRKKLFGEYAKFLVRRPFVILSLAIALTMLFAISMSTMKTKSTEYKDMLPKNVNSIKAMNFISDEFGSGGDTVMVVLETNPHYINSSEIRDIRDPRVIKHSSLLSQKLSQIQNVVSVSSASELLKERNGGYLPKTKTKIIELMEKDVTKNRTSLDTKQVLSRSSSGISGIQEGLEKETKGMEGIAQGLNSSEKGLEKTGSSVSKISEGMGKLKITKDWIKLIASIEKIKYLVSQSNATSSQKEKITTYLDSLEQDVKELGKEIETVNFASSKYSKGLTGVSQSVSGVESGLTKLENMTLQLKELNKGLNQKLGKIREGLKRAEQYIELFGESGESLGNEQIPKKENPFDRYISDDYTLAIINVQLADMSRTKKEETVEEINNIVDESEKPPGLEVSTTGSPVIYKELKAQIKPTMQKTTMVSFIGILIVVTLLFFSIRYGITSLLGIGFGTIWAFGFIALLGMSMSTQTSGAIAMVMGIGIDFGIQIVTRFRQEIRNKNPKKALTETLTNVIEPMLITTLSILIGFRAMSLGRLTFLATLGNMLSLGVVMCFFAAITVIPSVLMIGEKYFGSKK